MKLGIAGRMSVIAWCFVMLAIASGQGQEIVPPDPPVIGRWDVTVEGTEISYPSWFEIRKSGYRTLVGRYVGQFGSARPVSEVEYTDGLIHFSVPPQWEKRQTPVTYEGRLEGDTIRGHTTDDDGKSIAWVARRAPALDGEHPGSWETPVELFNGRDLEGWKTQFPNMENGWRVQDGILANVKPENNLLTSRQFTDFRLQVEFRYPRGSNSGIYLRGRYELQIEDNFGEQPDSHHIGGVYGFLTPSRNAALPAGEWQSYDITLIGRTLTVLLNGERIIDHQTIPGITGGALDSHEGEPGPILLQGDHGPVEFRKIVLTPWTSATVAQDVAQEGREGSSPVERAPSAVESVKPGINDAFLDPTLDVKEWLGRFEIESREVYAARRQVLEACQIKPGQTVADIGAGTGFYSRLFADAVGDKGWVYAVDISPRFLEHINQMAQNDGITNLTCVLGTDRTVRLPPNSIDVAFICDTYHHFEYPPATLTSIHRALKPGGTLVVIDFERIPGKSREFIIGHVRAGKDVFQGEIVAAGFRFIEEIPIPTFEENYLLRFRKP